MSKLFCGSTRVVTILVLIAVSGYVASGQSPVSSTTKTNLNSNLSSGFTLIFQSL